MLNFGFYQNLTIIKNKGVGDNKSVTYFSFTKGKNYMDDGSLEEI